MNCSLTRPPEHERAWEGRAEPSWQSDHVAGWVARASGGICPATNCEVLQSKPFKTVNKPSTARAAREGCNQR
eukprot:14997187-Alexandrium_andersonii.AAC.1